MSEIRRSQSLARPATQGQPADTERTLPLAAPATNVPEMRPILEAMRRGTKRSKLRTLVVACRGGHTLLEVFPTTAGPFMIWQDGGRLEWGSTGKMERTAPTVRAAPVADLAPMHAGDWVPVSPCRCQERAELTMSELLDALEAGTRRVILEPSE